MRTVTRFAQFSLLLILFVATGCNKDDDNGPVNPPSPNQAPIVGITSNTPDSIFFTETINFTWDAIDPDGTVMQFHAGLDGDYETTTEREQQYSGFNMGDAHVFSVFAEDDEGAYSDTESVDFGIRTYALGVELIAFGEGVIDDDSDGFWTGFNIRWKPVLPTGGTVEVKLVAFLKTTYGSSVEIQFSSDPVLRTSADADTMSFTIPTITKNLYDIRTEMQTPSGLVLDEIPYGTVNSLSGVGLEEFDGFFAWFDDAWIDNRIDNNGDDYFESVDLWWDADANPDAGFVKVVVYERNSSNEERQIHESFSYEIEGLGDQDANGVTIHAGTTFGDYDYRLVLLDTNNDVLDMVDYGDDSDLMDIPLGSTGSFMSHNTCKAFNK